MPRRRHATFNEILYPLADFGAMLVLPLPLSIFQQNSENLPRNLFFWLILAAFAAALITSHGGYKRQGLRSAKRHAILAINCYFAACFAMLGAAVLAGHPHILTRSWTAAVILATSALILAANMVAARILRPAITRAPLIICSDHYPEDLPGALSREGLASGISGEIYLASLQSPEYALRKAEVEKTQAALEAVRRGQIQDIVFVHDPQLCVATLTLHQEFMEELLAYPARIWLAFNIDEDVPELLKARTGGCRMVPIVTDDLLSAFNLPKRIFDVLGATILLVLLTPLIIVLAILIAMDSPGPIIFQQTRTGAQGRRFTAFKFRTMIFAPGAPFRQTTRNDSRVTKIGRLLRRTSMDELLQLINVIRGDMSLVGPRPHAPETEVEGISFEAAVRQYHLRQRVKPGMTGLAQIRGYRGETPAVAALEQRVASDLEYIQSWSLWLDVSIILRTLPLLFGPKNAY